MIQSKSFLTLIRIETDFRIVTKIHSVSEQNWKGDLVSRFWYIQDKTKCFQLLSSYQLQIAQN